MLAPLLHVPNLTELSASGNDPAKLTEIGLSLHISMIRLDQDGPGMERCMCRAGHWATQPFHWGHSHFRHCMQLVKWWRWQGRAWFSSEILGHLSWAPRTVTDTASQVITVSSGVGHI